MQTIPGPARNRVLIGDPGARLRSPGVSKQAIPKHGLTPPKGRPTPARHGRRSSDRLFGSTLQWAAAIALIALVFIVMFATLG